MPEETNLVIIHKEDVDLSRHINFTVHCTKVKAALEYKITNDPNYTDLIIDENALSQLPVNGSVADHIPTCCEGWQDGGAMPVGPDAAVATDNKDNEDGNTQFVGGVVDLGNQEWPEVEQL